jgi:chemotaxis protein MotB
MARRKRHEEHENHERWLVSYADFITLLFAFFTVLYATSQQDTKKQEQFEKSARKSFAIGVGLDSVGEPQPISNDFLESPFQTFPPAGSSAREVQNYVENKVKKDLSVEEYRATVEGINADQVGVRIQLATATLFASGSANLKEGAISSLDKIGQLLKKSNRKILVEGHTDDTPIHTPQYPSNWELSAARATKIVRYLILRHHLDPKQLVPIAYGDERPLVPNDSEENRAKNRRIEVLIVTDENRSL